jgi:chromosome partitioning protein
VIILVGSIKGGVGKSTLATNIAAYLAVKNKDVMLVDADRQSTSSNWYYDRSNNTKLPTVHSAQKYDNIKQTLDDFSRRYEYVVVDCQGRDSVELRTGLIATDICVVPCKPSQADLDTVHAMQETLKMAASINEKLKSYCVLTICPNNPVITEIADSINFLKKYDNMQLLNTLIYDRKNYRDALALGRGVIEMDNEKAKFEIESLMKELGHGC